MNNKNVQEMIELGRAFSQKNWMPGTCGNMSCLETRSPLAFTVSVSGVDKGSLTAEKFVTVTMGEGFAIAGITPTQAAPSTEVLTHATIYRLTGASAIVHLHSPQALMVAELFAKDKEFSFSGFEMERGLGFASIGVECKIPILCNVDSKESVASEFEKYYSKDAVALLIEKHGIFVWAPSIAEAKVRAELLQHVFEYSLVKENYQLAGLSKDFHAFRNTLSALSNFVSYLEKPDDPEEAKEVSRRAAVCIDKLTRQISDLEDRVKGA